MKPHPPFFLRKEKEVSYLDCYNSKAPDEGDYKDYALYLHDLMNFSETKQSILIHPDSVEAFKQLVVKYYNGSVGFKEGYFSYPLPSDSPVEIKYICENYGEVGVCPECKITSYAFLSSSAIKIESELFGRK